MVVELKNTSQCKRELEVTAGEPQNVAPATETPNGIYYLSNLDQNFTKIIIKTIYCFKSSEKGNETLVDVMKEALARVLVHYYPLAGRLMNIGPHDHSMKLVVNCTAEGAVFVEAEADCDMADIGDLAIPDPTIVGKLVYDIDGAKSILEVPPLMVQVTKFKCGGFTLGLTMSHGIFDGRGAMEFLSSWGETARGLRLSVQPVIDRSLLQPRKPPTICNKHHEFDELVDISDTASVFKEELMYQSFFFNAENLERLKYKALGDGSLITCTSFEVLSALVWRSRTAALQLKPDQKIKLLIFVDCRQRLNPPLPKGYFGNGVVLTSAIATSGELLMNPLSYAIRLVQGAIKMVTNEYVRSVIDYIEITHAHVPIASTDLLISTWSRLGFHGADFGWGQPTATGLGMLPEKEVALFLPHGVERGSTNVLVGLPSFAMAKFQELMKEFN